MGSDRMDFLFQRFHAQLGILARYVVFLIASMGIAASVSAAVNLEADDRLQPIECQTKANTKCN